MDAIEFLKERNRMCKTNVSCYNCPAHDLARSNSCKFAMENWTSPEQQINLVKEWAAAHPCKTRQSVFLEQYPDTQLDAFGVIELCPIPISAAHRDNTGICKTPEKMCAECRREFWKQEVE